MDEEVRLSLIAELLRWLIIIIFCVSDKMVQLILFSDRRIEKLEGRKQEKGNYSFMVFRLALCHGKSPFPEQSLIFLFFPKIAHSSHLHKICNTEFLRFIYSLRTVLVIPSLTNEWEPYYKQEKVC